MSDEVRVESRPLRADAVRNREKILDAAATVFAERGLEASLDDIAHRAGVGVGTLYRRFPDKDALVDALFENAVDEIASMALRASEVENSWEGLVWFLEQVLQRQCANRGLRDAVVGSASGRGRIAEATRRVSPILEGLVQRAQRDGYLREDVVEVDFKILESMVSSLGALASPSSPDLWRRYLTIILDGLAVQRTGPSPLTQAPPREDVATEMMHLKRQQTRRVRDGS
jgi:AcrR family transcriptional regulator